MTNRNLRNLPAVVYLPTRRLHAAYAAGSSLDGSLYGFFTLCQRRIGDEEVWREINTTHPYASDAKAVHHCKQCQRIIDRDDEPR